MPMQVIARDITEQVRARQALEESEQRYRELVEDVTEILFTVDREGRFVSLNRSFERSTGYRVEEWIGRPFAELFMPHSVSAAVEDFEQALAGRERLVHEYDLLAQSGAVVTVEVSWQPRYVDGVMAGTIGMARDVTEHRNIARKLEEAKRMSSLGQVAASLAHEFNNVLMGIQPFVEVIGRSNPITPVVRDSLGHITRAIGRGKRASQEILRFANPKEPQLSAIDASVWLPTCSGNWWRRFLLRSRSAARWIRTCASSAATANISSRSSPTSFSTRAMPSAVPARSRSTSRRPARREAAVRRRSSFESPCPTTAPASRRPSSTASSSRSSPPSATAPASVWPSRAG